MICVDNVEMVRRHECCQTTRNGQITNTKSKIVVSDLKAEWKQCGHEFRL